MSAARRTLAGLCLASLGLATAAWAQPATAPGAGKPPPPRPQARARVPPPVPAKLPPAPGEQLAAAAMAHFGEYACEFNEVVNVDVNHQNDGYLDVKHRKAVYVMKPVLSSTGALRLEDVKGRMLMLQIANKSMLMDTKIGQRVVDGCVHEKQRDAATRPAGQSLGIEAARPAAGASAPS